MSEISMYAQGKSDALKFIKDGILPDKPPGHLPTSEYYSWFDGFWDGYSSKIEDGAQFYDHLESLKKRGPRSYIP